MSARLDAGDEDPVAGLQRRYGGADFGDGSYSFVAQDPALLYRRDVAFQNVEIRPANGRGVHFNDGIPRVLDRGVRHVHP
jgi:hypothetical protein